MLGLVFRHAVPDLADMRKAGLEAEAVDRMRRNRWKLAVGEVDDVGHEALP
jgi:hypothetical protein